MGFAKFSSEWGPAYDGIWDHDVQHGVGMQRCADKNHYFFGKAILSDYERLWHLHLGNCEIVKDEIRRDGDGLRYVNEKPVEVQRWKKTLAQPATSKHGKVGYVDAQQVLGKGGVRG